MKALQVNAEWKPREGYIPSQREVRDQRAMRGNLVFHNPEMHFVDISLRPLEPGEALMKVGACGVCGSDTLFLGKDDEGYTHYSSHCKFPVVIGHEFAGEIVETNKTENIKVGDLVTGENMYWCGSCGACKTGMFNQCERLEEVGFTLNGAYAEFVIINERNAYKLNKLQKILSSKRDIFRHGCIIEPLAVAYGGIFRKAGGFLPGGNAVVFGCGPIGQAAITMLRVAGAAAIFAFDILDERLKLAAEMGADYVFNPKTMSVSPSEIIMEKTDGEGVSIGVEATEKHNATIPEMEKALGVGGKIVQIGISANTTTVSSSAFQKKGASYYGTNGTAGGHFANIINLMAAKRIDFSNIITDYYSLDKAMDAIASAKAGGCGKIIVEP
jgi:threonine dehydrogenase-like Zn-dependent dehydrogenase